MNLFLDTNIFLSFYHFSNDDLVELEKLARLIKTGKAILFLPQQVQDEFLRSREKKIKDAIQRLRQQKVGNQFPQMSKGYEQYDELREMGLQHNARLAELLTRMGEDARADSLKADVTINALFKHALRIAPNEAVILRAQQRRVLGNPPGKPGSVGDAVNWEYLLHEVPRDEDLCFVTDDSDYSSVLNKTDFHPFLLKEWRAIKSADIKFYTQLSDFLAAHFPEITLERESEKDEAIDQFLESDSYAATHVAVASLQLYQDLSPVQVNAIVAGALANSQIHEIASDNDVWAFLVNISQQEHDLTAENRQGLRNLLQAAAEHRRNLGRGVGANWPSLAILV